MENKILKLERVAVECHSTFRTLIKTQHGRMLYLELQLSGNDCLITECFYTDRNQGKTGAKRRNAKPLNLRTLQFDLDALLTVLKTELDSSFYSVEFIETDTAELSVEKYIEERSNSENKKYRFLIMIGEGEQINGLPSKLVTRIKNKLHRSIFVELAYYRDGMGVVKQCYYYDRSYKRQDIQITPPQLVSCFFQYERGAILNLFNHELCCDLNRMIVISDNKIDIYKNKTPLCGCI
jgi:hypothetical protein